MYALWMLFADIVTGVEEEEAGVGSRVRNTEKIPFLKAPKSFMFLINRGPLFCCGDINWRPKPIIPYFAV
jgi:hypothetical protein